MKPKVYLETTIPSYLTAWPSRDLVRAAHQQITREWWDLRRPEFDLYISSIVLEEIRAGDPSAASDRLKAVEGIPVLDASDDAKDLAREIMAGARLPTRATVDALHIAIAVVAGMDYLLTWNCTHIANAALREIIRSIIHSAGYESPVICTPQELQEDIDASR